MNLWIRLVEPPASVVFACTPTSPRGWQPAHEDIVPHPSRSTAFPRLCLPRSWPSPPPARRVGVGGPPRLQAVPLSGPPRLLLGSAVARADLRATVAVRPPGRRVCPGPPAGRPPRRRRAVSPLCWLSRPVPGRATAAPHTSHRVPARRTAEPGSPCAPPGRTSGVELDRTHHPIERARRTAPARPPLWLRGRRRPRASKSLTRTSPRRAAAPVRRAQPGRRRTDTAPGRCRGSPGRAGRARPSSASSAVSGSSLAARWT